MGDASTAGAVPAIAAVVVTYGQRLHVLEPTLRGLAAQPAVGRLLVVDNGAASAVGEWLAGYEAEEPRLAVLRHPENLGSAGGFRSGLAAASAADSRFVWVLDDDTRPEPGAAAALLDAWAAGGFANHRKPIALLSQRWEAERYRRESGWNVNAAFGVDLLDRIRRRAMLPWPERDSDARRARLQPCLETVRMAPWSGLFFERVLLDRIGLPDERFISYEEDHEFTLRITARGGRIILVPGSRLISQEPMWLERAHGRFVSARLNPKPPEHDATNLDDADRVYYGARNRVYLETRRLVTSRLRYYPNLAAFVCRVALTGLRAANRRNTRWFLAGVIDGLRGRLGRRE